MDNCFTFFYQSEILNFFWGGIVIFFKISCFQWKGCTLLKKFYDQQLFYWLRRDSGYEINLFPMKVQSEFSVMKLWQYIITKPKDEFISEKGLYGRCNTLEELGILFLDFFFCTTAIRSADFPDSTDSAKSVGFYLTQGDLPDLPVLTSDLN